MNFGVFVAEAANTSLYSTNTSTIRSRSAALRCSSTWAAIFSTNSSLLTSLVFFFSLIDFTFTSLAYISLSISTSLDSIFASHFDSSYSSFNWTSYFFFNSVTTPTIASASIWIGFGFMFITFVTKLSPVHITRATMASFRCIGSTTTLSFTIRWSAITFTSFTEYGGTVTARSNRTILSSRLITVPLDNSTFLIWPRPIITSSVKFGITQNVIICGLFDSPSNSTGNVTSPAQGISPPPAWRIFLLVSTNGYTFLFILW